MKICPRCKEEKDESAFYRVKTTLSSYCRLCWCEYNKDRYRRDGPKPRKWTAKDYYRALRIQVLTGYGNRCVCCGETQWEFLTLDHVNGGGGKHRKTHGQHAHYQDAKRRGYPPDYRILCYNCNCTMAFRGYCPHQGGAAAQRALEEEGRNVHIPVLESTITT